MTEPENDVHEVDDSNEKTDYLIRWRREKVWELRALHYTIDEIVDIIRAGKPEVRVSHGTVCRDLEAKHREIEASFKRYIEKELPRQHHLAVATLEKIAKEAYKVYLKSIDERAKISALNLIHAVTMSLQQVYGDPAEIDRALAIAAQLERRLGLPRQEEHPETVSADAPQSKLEATTA